MPELSYNGPEAQSVPVPAGVTAAQFVLTGASGGNGNSPAQGAFAGGRGGYGAVVSGTIAVTGVSTVEVSVGGQGGHYGTNPANNHGGWGAASGGPGGVNPNLGEGNGAGGGGGGGSTSLVINGAVIAVAGGGGGGGTGGVGPFNGTGGDGGGSGEPAHGGNNGNGASHGDGGQAGSEINGAGAPGGIGSGGDDSPGGGGGGGVFGGQGGHGASGAAGGGGAGTCMVAPQVTSPAVRYGTALGDGQATITWIPNS